MFLLSNSANAIIPIENITLEDYLSDVQLSFSDPLDHLFKISRDFDVNTQLKHKKHLANYRGFYEEGKNLEKFCSENFTRLKEEVWQKEQVNLSVAATLQKIGLLKTSKAISEYSKALGYSKDQYENLVTNIWGNYCSLNTSVISLEKLKKLMFGYYDESFDVLPSLDGHPLFSSKLDQYKPKIEVLENELKTTILLFRSFCSWGTNLGQYRLMVPLLKNPVIFSYLIRELSGQALDWDKVSNQILLKRNQKTTKVFCNGLICREITERSEFENALKGVGFVSYENDLKRVYCGSFRDISYETKGELEQIQKWMREQSFDVENLMVGQMTALLTGVPEFAFRVESFSDYIKLARLGLDHSWGRWARDIKEKGEENIHYEEALRVEVVDRKLYFKPHRRNFSVEIDVNLGEFDREHQRLGKLSTTFNIKLSKAVINHVQKLLEKPNPYPMGKNESSVNRIEKAIEDQVLKAQDKLAFTPWRDQISKLIAKELVNQISLYPKSPYRNGDNQFIQVPITFNYAPFALKYMNDRYRAVSSSIEQ
ncbi:MAG: hypothetical protein ACPGJV_10995 [Bacteriovoracaceae bacterium]